MIQIGSGRRRLLNQTTHFRLFVLDGLEATTWATMEDGLGSVDAIDRSGEGFS
jgi:hypothetical protein